MAFPKELITSTYHVEKVAPHDFASNPDEAVRFAMADLAIFGATSISNIFENGLTASDEIYDINSYREKESKIITPKEYFENFPGMKELYTALGSIIVGGELQIAPVELRPRNDEGWHKDNRFGKMFNDKLSSHPMPDPARGIRVLAHHAGKISSVRVLEQGGVLKYRRGMKYTPNLYGYPTPYAKIREHEYPSNGVVILAGAKLDGSTGVPIGLATDSSDTTRIVERQPEWHEGQKTGTRLLSLTDVHITKGAHFNTQSK